MRHLRFRRLDGGLWGSWGSCEPANVRLSVEITPELIDRVVEYLNDPEDWRRVWRGFLFMEKNGIDPAVMSAELNAYLNAPASPLPNPRALDPSDERALVLSLRARARVDLGLRPLDDEQCRAWRYQVPKQPAWRPDQLKPQSLVGTYRASAEELSRSIEKIMAEDPRLVPALLHILSANIQLELGEKVDVSWFARQIRPITANLFPFMTAVDVHQFSIDLLDYLTSSNSTQ